MTLRFFITYISSVYFSFAYAQPSVVITSLLSAKQVNNTVIYRHLADSLNTLRQNEQAILLLEKALTSKVLVNNELEAATIYQVMGNCYDDMQEFRKGILYFDKSLHSAEKLGNKELMIKNYVGLAGAYSDLVITDSTLYYSNKALVLCEKDKDTYFKYLKVVYNTLGLAYTSKFDFPKTITYFYKAIDLCKTKNDINGLTSSYNNLGNLYCELKDYTKGLEYYRKVLQIKPSPSSLVNIGILYEDLNMDDSAFYYVKKAILLDKMSENRGGLSTSYTVVGNLFKRAKQLDSAFYYYNLSSKIALEIEDYQVIQNNEYNIIEILLSQKKYQQAKVLAEKNLKSLSQGNDLSFISDTYNQLKDIAIALGQYKQAYEYQAKYTVYKDSAVEADKSIEVKKIELTAEYKTKSSNDSLLHAQATLLNNVRHDAEIKKQRMVLFGIVFILILVAAFLIFVYKRYQITIRQKEIINLQKNEMYSQKLLVEEKQKEILDSIHYAKRIQYALIANTEFLDKHLPDKFIYFNPKDIVSGDFYWATEHQHKFYLAVCDSTGHGVPGAFMSLLNIGYLSEAINEKNITQPNEVFNYVRTRLENSISKEGQKDGFDGVLICIDVKSKQIRYTAANNKPILIREQQIIELSSDRMPVGIGEKKEEFKEYVIDVKPGDILYLYTDGYADQFGGQKGKKYKYKALNQLILMHHEKTMQQQQQLLQDHFKDWQGALEQVDDVCVVGIRF